MTYKLTILICGLGSRAEEFTALTSNLFRQYYGKEATMDTLTDNGEMSIGEKRNRLLENVKTEYVCFIDDDDMVSSDYIDKIMEALKQNPDCCSLTGVITWDGLNPELFEHSIKYKEYKTTNNSIKYERYPNHLNVIRTSIAKQFRFPETNHGEDTDWATQIFNSGLLKTEATIPGVIYHYQYKTIK